MSDDLEAVLKDAGEHMRRQKERIKQLELVEKAFEQNQQTWSRNIARIEQLEAAINTFLDDWDDGGPMCLPLRAALEGKKDE